MTYQPHQFSNLYFPKKYLQKLPADDINIAYYNGQKFASSFIYRMKLLFSIDSKLRELKQFYPYHPLIQSTYKTYQQRKQSNLLLSTGISMGSIFLIFNFARQNKVAPVLRKFGKYFKTHRLLRQYLLALTLPFAFSYTYSNYSFLNQTEKLLIVHAERLNKKILSDPIGSKYPSDLLPISEVGTWWVPFVLRYDRTKKRANETHIGLAPDYSQEEWPQSALSQKSEEQPSEEVAEEVAEEVSEEQ